jgi:nucleoside 2-deoxyribosyltransferase
MANFSSYIRENQGELFTEDDFEFVQRIPAPTVPQKADKLLRFIAQMHPYAGEEFQIPSEATERLLVIIAGYSQEMYDEEPAFFEECDILLPYIAVSWSRNVEEFLFILKRQLRGKDDYFIQEGGAPPFFSITPQGWTHLESLDSPTTETAKAFVAMWFNPTTEQLWKEALRDGIYAAGYEPIRMDAVEHSNKIDDEIIAQIRAAKFVVADFTGQRGGVYFEAGFALGLGKRVIWCVEDSDLKNIHFDNRQYNFLRWKADNVSSFKHALQHRIEALFGKGPVTI